MTVAPRFRVGFVAARFGLLDAQLAADAPERLRARASQLAASLEQHFDVVFPGLIEDLADAERIGRALSTERLDAVVFAPVMAVPPNYAKTALDDLGAPLVIWNALELRRLPADLTLAAASVQTSTAACQMLANVLVRAGRTPQVVTTAPDDAPSFERLRRTIAGAAAAGSLRGGTLLRVGEPLAGYLDLEVSAGHLTRIGLREESVSIHELHEAFAATTDEEARAVLDLIRERGWSGDGGPNLERSARLAQALGRFVARTGAIGGAVNCHGPYFRGSTEIGIPACLAVSLFTDAGRPFACSGDLPTAIALYLVRRLAGAALACAPVAPEPETGLLLLATDGEGDPRSAESDDAVRLATNERHPGQRGLGASLVLKPRPGPATLVSFSPARDSWVLAWATGEVAEPWFERLGVPNALFRFATEAKEQPITKWIASGATHHSVLAPGHLDVELPALAEALLVRGVRV